MSAKIDFKKNTQICATICAITMISYWYVPGMFFDDKRVIGDPQSNTNDNAFATQLLAIKQQRAVHPSRGSPVFSKDQDMEEKLGPICHFARPGQACPVVVLESRICPVADQNYKTCPLAIQQINPS